MTFNIVPNLQTFYNSVLCSLLFVKHLLFTRKLVVKNFFYTNKIIVRGNQTELNWKTRGCHKILVKGLGILPGNVSQINLTLKNKINPLEITFYGVGGQRDIKNFEIKTNSTSVLNSFTPITNISKLTSVPLIKEDLKMILVSSFNYKEPKRIEFQKPKILYQNLKMNFEPFIKSNYPIKS